MPVSLNFSTLAPAIMERRRTRPRPPGPVELPDVSTPPFIPEPTSIPDAAEMRLNELARMRYEQRKPTRFEEMNEAKDAYVEGAPGRGKSGLLGALRGGLQGLATGGLGGAVGGAIGGFAGGALNPKGLREQQFNEQIRPQILERFGFEDMDSVRQAASAKAQQDAAFNQARIGQMQAETEESRARAFKLSQPEAPKAKPQQWKLGRHNATGRFAWFDVNDPASASEHTPHVQQPNQPSRFVVNEKGEYVDVNAEAAAGRKVKAFQRPKAPREPKKEQKFVSIDKVMKFAEKQGIPLGEAKARARADGFTVVN